MARLWPSRTAHARNPGHLRALVHQRDRRHCDASASDHPRLLRLPGWLFNINYPAPGLPGLAEEVSDLVKPTWVGADLDSWGIDHGTWSVLVHAFPDASIPVVQMSINADKPFDYYLDLGACLAPLRESGVLVIGSGNVVHNLGAMNWDLVNDGYDWAQRFDTDAKQQMLTNPTEFATLDGHRDFGLAVPTPDHFLPALYLAGLASAAGGDSTHVLIDGYAYGSLSMTAYTVGFNDVVTPQRARITRTSSGRTPGRLEHLKTNPAAPRTCGQKGDCPDFARDHLACSSTCWNQRVHTSGSGPKRM